jgi:hypothetical protein
VAQVMAIVVVVVVVDVDVVDVVVVVLEVVVVVVELVVEVVVLVLVVDVVVVEVDVMAVQKRTVEAKEADATTTVEETTCSWLPDWVLPSANLILHDARSHPCSRLNKGDAMILHATRAKFVALCREHTGDEVNVRTQQQQQTPNLPRTTHALIQHGGKQIEGTSDHIQVGNTQSQAIAHDRCSS